MMAWKALEARNPTFETKKIPKRLRTSRNLPKNQRARWVVSSRIWHLQPSLPPRNTWRVPCWETTLPKCSLKNRKIWENPTTKRVEMRKRRKRNDSVCSAGKRTKRREASMSTRNSARAFRSLPPERTIKAFTTRFRLTNLRQMKTRINTIPTLMPRFPIITPIPGSICACRPCRFHRDKSSRQTKKTKNTILTFTVPTQNIACRFPNEIPLVAGGNQLCPRPCLRTLSLRPTKTKKNTIPAFTGPAIRTILLLLSPLHQTRTRKNMIPTFTGIIRNIPRASGTTKTTHWRVHRRGEDTLGDHHGHRHAIRNIRIYIYIYTATHLYFLPCTLPETIVLFSYSYDTIVTL
mmetsp:Transcript_25/g.53  ORF Transcript_25/g.53 Transcript_25/m.53 type:complete len:349 (+) Transcript_25:53-1099(+)